VVHVAPGASAHLAATIAERRPGARVAIITDSNVAACQSAPLDGATILEFPAGEQHKTRATWGHLTDQLIASRHDRNTVIVGFGGGVTTDLAGFVAATFLRGVPWIAMPTSTLGMIDAAIGGKTGVDTTAGKNLVGAFHNPLAIIADITTLDTLPDRYFREGLAEAVKHAAILDADYGEWIETHADRIIARDPATVTQLIARSARLKADVVSGDEDEGGRRAILNAGHTVAHALEQATAYGMSHGEAVAIGLVQESRIGERTGHTAVGTAARIAHLLERVGLPTEMPAEYPLATLATAAASDKKNRGGVVRAAFITSFGQVDPRGGAWTAELDLGMLP
jgi:3-dehydroquinate synthase